MKNFMKNYVRVCNGNFQIKNKNKKKFPNFQHETVIILNGGDFCSNVVMFIDLFYTKNKLL